MNEVLGPAAAARIVLDALNRRAPAVVITLLEPLRTPPPRRVLVGDLSVGSLGDAMLDAAADAAAYGGDGLTRRDALRTPRRVRLSDRGVTVLIEPHVPAEELIIVGAGHIAVPLAQMAALADFDVRVLDDRPAFATGERFPAAARVECVDFGGNPFAGVSLGPLSYVVLVTRAHRYDFDCLRRLLRRGMPQPAYIGVIGSRRRLRAAFQALLGEGVQRERLARVRAPVGLDISAETPAEIAVSVLAEMIAHRRAASHAPSPPAGRPLVEVERIMDRHFPGADAV